MPTRRALIALFISLAAAGPAQAQNGVTVDPGSPSGKEYAIPLDSARRDAASERSSTDPGTDGGQSAPLFGEGVGDDPSPTGNRPHQARVSKSQPRSRSRASATATPASVGTAVPAVRRAAATVPDSGSSVLTIGAVALSVLLLGAVIGSIARRREP